MLGLLPTSIDIDDTSYKIRTDYRDILRIVSAFNDDELTDKEKVYICMKQIFVDFNRIPQKSFEAAYKAAISFIECHTHDDRPSPKIVNWAKDEQLIFPAINKVAGFEVRAVPYMHWWTFMGYFQGIDRDDTWGFILSIRQKKAKHKKLEKYEQEFYSANRAMCDVNEPKNPAVENEKALMDIYKNLMKGDAE